MIERGLYTTKADIGAHFSPHDQCFYSYFYSEIREADKILPLERLRTGNSSRGIAVMITGHRQFICRSAVPDDLYEKRFGDVRGESDTEMGQRAESLFKDCAEMGLIKVPQPTRLEKYYTNLADQYAGRDFRVATNVGAYDVDTKYDGRSGLWALKSKIPYEANPPTGRLYIETHEGDSITGDRHRYAQRRSHDNRNK